MRKLSILFYLCSLNIFAASVTVAPFEMELDLQKGYKLQGSIELACRLEKWVWGDSAQYETFYQDPSELRITTIDNGDFNKIIINNPNELYYEYDRFFSSDEECRASFKFQFISLNYAMGYGIKPKKPVTFQLWKGFYDYQKGDQRYDLNKMRKYLDRTVYTFVEREVTNSHINVWIKQDGREASTSPWVEKAYLNPETGKPYTPIL